MQWLQYVMPAILLIVIAAIDIRYYIIPDALLLLILCSVLLSDLVLQQGRIVAILFQIGSRIGNGIAIFIPLLLFILLMDKLLQKESMGGGDLKLMFVVGYWMGAKAAYMVLYLAAIIGLVWCVCMHWRKGHKLLPFGPFIVMACGIVFLYGHELQEKFFCIF